MLDRDKGVAHLKSKAYLSVVWTAADLFSRQGLQFIISVILARLLSPEEFGVIGMLALFTGIAAVVADSGFTSAMIQKRDLSEEEKSSVFYFNLGTAAVLALALCLSGRRISVFYGMPILEPLTYALAFNLFLSAFGIVQRALMTIELDFRTPMRINITATVASSIVGILMAWRGFGVWSLACQMILSTLVSNILTWYHRPWRPALAFQFTSLQRLFRFGGYMMFSGILDMVYTRMNTLIIGKLYSARDLGQYMRADRTQQLPGNVIGTLVGRIAFPIFAAAGEDKKLLRQGLRKSVVFLMMVNLPLMLGLLAISRPLIMTIYGPKWEACIPYLQVLCLGGVLWPLHVVNLSALKALGRSDLFFQLELLKKAIGFTAIIVASSIGIIAMAWSQVFLGVVGFFINAYYSGKFLNYSAWQQTKDILPYGGVAIAMGGGIWLLGLSDKLSTSLVLLIQLIIGAMFYVSVCMSLRLTAFREMIDRVRARLALGLSKQ